MTIYVRASAGQEAAFSPSSTVPRKLRSLLMAVDGKTTVAMYIQSLQAFGDVENQLAELHADGLLAVVDTELLSPDSSASESISSDARRQNQSSTSANAVLQQRADDKVAVSPSSVATKASLRAASSSHDDNALSAGRASRTEPDIEMWKDSMVRDVTAVLGADAELVVSKIHRCQNADDLFTTFMGVRKIIALYVNQKAADQFASRHLHLC